ncbi:MAG: ABC transporter ATP-binding protein [Tissierellia bacterium]|nr:ABC transporter ATP-binding protein [Tissierellia bacterium]
MIKIKHLKKVFGKKKIYDDLNVEMREGEVFALIGPNGVGKTTLMKILLKWDRDFTGVIEYPEKYTLGYSPESPDFPEVLTGRQVLEYFMEVEGMDASKRKEESKRLMEKVGLSLEKDTKVKYYSKGMNQRLGLAQALIGDPEILLLDEPSAGLDFFGQQQMQNIIFELKEASKLIILNSHLLYDVEKVADRGMIIMNEKDQRCFSQEDLKEKSLADLFMEVANESTY